MWLWKIFVRQDSVAPLPQLFCTRWRHLVPDQITYFLQHVVCININISDNSNSIKESLDKLQNFVLLKDLKLRSQIFLLKDLIWKSQIFLLRNSKSSCISCQPKDWRSKSHILPRKGLRCSSQVFLLKKLRLSSHFFLLEDYILKCFFST